jgi:hypothetical protein
MPVGVGIGTALAASSFSICSGVRFQPIAPRFCFNCSSLRAPSTIVLTVGRCKSRLRNTEAGFAEKAVLHVIPLLHFPDRRHHRLQLNLPLV